MTGPRMPQTAPSRDGGWLAPLLVYAGAGLAAASLLERRRTAEAEAAHPPRGRFLDTGTARLHYLEVGDGPPVVFLHGIGATLDDIFISGVVDALLPGYRVLAVDRPGSGYSSRGHGGGSPEAQADALAPLLKRLGAEGAVVVGHSFGALVALALALRHPRTAASLVLVGAPFFPGAEIFAKVGRVPHVPLLSDIARATVTPAAARAVAPRFYETFFEPQPVTRRFLEQYPLALACRPSQLKASAEDADGADAALRRLVPAATRLSCPIAVVAGSGDALFEPDGHARPFAAAVGAALAIVPGGGHMVHHSFPGAVATVIRDAAEGRLPLPLLRAPVRRAPAFAPPPFEEAEPLLSAEGPGLGGGAEGLAADEDPTFAAADFGTPRDGDEDYGEDAATQGDGGRYDEAHGDEAGGDDGDGRGGETDGDEAHGAEGDASRARSRTRTTSSSRSGKSKSKRR
jgi:pimeloyl-ACP methyl ester carboxylesterase